MNTKSQPHENTTKIYLDEPITIKGIRIGHTKYGLEFMIKHQSDILEHHASKLLPSDRDHAQRCIENYRQHLELYRIQEEENTKQKSK